MSTEPYTYPSGFAVGQKVLSVGGNHVGVVTSPGGGNGTASGYVAVNYGTRNGHYVGTLKQRATDLELVTQ